MVARTLRSLALASSLQAATHFVPIQPLSASPAYGTVVGGRVDGRVSAAVVAGRVTEAETGAPVVGASVVIVDTTLGAVSGQDGRYLIGGVPAGTFTVRATVLGRQPETKSVTVGGDGRVDATFSLRVATLPVVVIDGVRVRGQAAALARQQNAPNISNVVASDQMGRFPDASAPDAVQRLPGVAIERDLGEGRYIQIRGGAARNTQVTFNGEQVPSPEGDARQIALDAVPVDVLESIEVAKAITPSMDAEAIGGSVNLVTRKAPDGGLFSFEGSGGFGSIRDEFSGTGALVIGNRPRTGRLGYLFSGSFSRRNFGADSIEPAYEDRPVTRHRTVESSNRSAGSPTEAHVGSRPDTGRRDHHFAERRQPGRPTGRSCSVQPSSLGGAGQRSRPVGHTVRVRCQSVPAYGS